MSVLNMGPDHDRDRIANIVRNRSNTIQTERPSQSKITSIPKSKSELKLPAIPIRSPHKLSKDYWNAELEQKF